MRRVAARGTVRFSGGRALRIAPRDVRWVTDATIDGTAWWNQSSGQVIARLTVRRDHGRAVRLTARWLVYAQRDQPAVITGSAGRTYLAPPSSAP